MKPKIDFFAAILLLVTVGGALAEVHYVDVNSTNATPPYLSWTTAATNIQDAVDAAVAGDDIAVTNGTYYAVVVGMPLTLRSVNGPELTAISGSGSARCVDLPSGSRLSGFTLTNGVAYGTGGGVRCQSTSAVVSNCVITGNQVHGQNDGDFGGGGAYGGTLDNCTLSFNSVSATGGGDFSHMYARGGGAYNCTLRNCTLSGNSARVPHQSPFVSAYEAFGGGAHSCGLDNCTLTGNSVVAEDFSGLYRAAAYDGGASSCTMNNCIAYFNTSFDNFGPSHEDDAYDDSLLNYCCTPLLPSFGVGNITNAPLFVDTNGWSNLRLQSNSPCINAGNNSYVTSATDLDGNPRIAGGTVDIGAYEFQSPASMISYAWLQQFNLPINPSTDTADPDGDGVNNYHEWLAGSDPTNPFSFPPLLTLIPYGANVILTWPTNAFGFTLQSTTNLGSPAVWDTNSPAPVVIGGQNVVTNPLTGPQQFFRLSQ